jgi:hypothetical protein
MPVPAPLTSTSLRHPAAPPSAGAGRHSRSAGPRDAGGPVPGEAFVVDCAACVHQHTPVCADCVVTFVVGREPDDALVVDAAEARAVHLLGSAGLLPALRHARQVS